MPGLLQTFLKRHMPLVYNPSIAFIDSKAAFDAPTLGATLEDIDLLSNRSDRLTLGLGAQGIGADVVECCRPANYKSQCRLDLMLTAKVPHEDLHQAGSRAGTQRRILPLQHRAQLTRPVDKAPDFGIAVGFVCIIPALRSDSLSCSVSRSAFSFHCRSRC
jgi:hypothetical protein